MASRGARVRAARARTLRHARHVGPESLLVVAQNDGAVRAFFNVCQHRGTRLSIVDRGKASRFRCPYHHWEWECDGRLHHVPDAASFVAGVPCDELQLAGVPCAVRLGFVWVAMGPDVEDIDAYLAPFASEIAAYRPEALSLVGENVVEVECNWKTSVDVHNEGYHLRSLHPRAGSRGRPRSATDYVARTAQPHRRPDRHASTRISARSGAARDAAVLRRRPGRPGHRPRRRARRDSQRGLGAGEDRWRGSLGAR